MLERAGFRNYGCKSIANLLRSAAPPRWFQTKRALASLAGPCGCSARHRHSVGACRAGKECVSYENWRMGWDSNPRYAFDVYALSRRAPSTARPPIRNNASTAPSIGTQRVASNRFVSVACPALNCHGFARGYFFLRYAAMNES